MIRQFLLLLWIAPAFLYAQNKPASAPVLPKYSVAFAKDADSQHRSSGDNKVLELEISYSGTEADALKDYKVYASINEYKSTLPKMDYEILSPIEGISFKDLKPGKNILRVLLKKDNPKDKQVKNLVLAFKLSIRKKQDNEEKGDEETNNEGKIKEASFVILPAEQPSPSPETNKEKASRYSISFKKDKDTLQRSPGTVSNFTIELLASDTKLDNYKLSADIDADKSTLPRKDYEVISGISKVDFKDIKPEKNYLVIQIKSDDPKDKQLKDLKLVLKLSVQKKQNEKEEEDEAANNDGKIKEIELTIRPADAPLENYRYLGYLGTNFDLVDGVQANRLYFVVNVLLPQQKKYGINLGIYGNRTMTRTDTSANTSFTSRIDAYGPDSIIYSRDTAMKVRTQLSDNIGAYFNPLIPLKFLSEGNLQVYYAPNFEFIWRRSKFETNFLNNKTIAKDTAENRYPATTAFPLVTPLSIKATQNIYDVYLGLAGLMLRYENEDISIRLQAAVGFNFNYVPVGALSGDNIFYHKNDRIYFQARLMITEPTTGFSLGAEISNFFGSYKNPPYYSKAQPYYNVTLSKAFNLKNLAAIVKPLSNR